MNESSLSTPLLASSSPVASREGSPNYNSTEDATNNNNNTSESLQVLDYDGSLSDSDMSIAEDKTTESQTFIHLLKGYIGPGCLSLPWAVSQVGFVGGTIAIAIMSFWS